MANKKSDVNAKKVFRKELLEKKGFDTAEIVSFPSDIRATKDGETWYFEIKKTLRKDIYFGAATETEWAQALKDPDHFRFVVVRTDEEETFFEFMEFTPKEFMRGCTIPPFKVYFDVNMMTCQMVDKTQSKRATIFTEERFNRLHKAYKVLKCIS